MNKERLNKDLDPYSNPRNTASGSLKLLDSKEVAKRPLDCFLYYVLGEDLPSNSHFDNLQFAKEWGFKVPNEIKRYDNKFRFGAAYSNKDRDFTTSNYQIGFLGLSSSLNGDPNQLLLPSNLWRLQTPYRGAYTIGSYQRTNQYMSKSSTTAAYVSNELKISNKLKSPFEIF